MLRTLYIGLLSLAPFASTYAGCPTTGVHLQVLGSGGSELASGRAGSSYLVWIDGKARALVDVGSGSAMRFGQSGANFADLRFIALSRLQSDHTGGLPALVRAAKNGNRTKPLPIFGPDGNKVMPSTVAFVRTLFDQKRGAWRELGQVLSPLGKQGYRLQPHDIRTRVKQGKPILKNVKKTNPVFVGPNLRLSAAPIIHGVTTTLAWKLVARGKTIVFTGEAGQNSDKLPALTKGANLLVAHISTHKEQSLSQTTSYLQSAKAVGHIAHRAGADRLVISRRLSATLGHEQNILREIKKSYQGNVQFADDLSCFAL
ncbi:MAG: MBL fold metallo-hydrolase [Acidiferrobacterales bacterium]